MDSKVGIFFMLFLSTVCVNSQTNDSVMLATVMKAPSNMETPDSIIKLIWSSEHNSWNFERKLIYQYNIDGLKINEKHSEWQNNNWLIQYETFYTYNGTNLTEQVRNWWDDYYSSWIPITKYSFVYNNFNQISQKLDYKWIQSKNSWENDSSITYVYNDYQQLLKINVEVWSDYFIAWENNSQTIYNYNSGINDRQTFSIWDFDYLIWDDRIITDFVYDNSNQIIEKWLMTKNSLYANWVNYVKTEYTYLSGNHIDSEIYWRWDAKNIIWVEDYKITYEYDKDLKLKTKTISYYDAYYLEWWNRYRTDYDYNYPSQIVATTYYLDYGQWRPLYCFNYYYPGYNSIEILKPNYTIELFPNPTKDRVQVEFGKPFFGEAKISINDLSGKEICTNYYQVSESNIELKLPNLSDGLYLLHLFIANQIITKKILIKN